MELSELTWTDVRDLDTDLAVLPIGSTEQHGPHAPLGTDAFHATSVATAGADQFEADQDSPVLVGPTIPVGIAEEHRHFDGTLWVSPETFRSYVRETVASLAHHGFDRVVLVNGHGGNIPALGETAAAISRQDDAYAVAFTWFDAVGDHADRMGHGGPLETGLLRHTHPDLVREDRTDEAAGGGSETWGEWVSGVNLAHDSAEFTANGTIGDPREGDAALGEELLSMAAEALAELLVEVRDRDLDGSG